VNRLAAAAIHAAFLASASGAFAQEMPGMPSATAPSPGVLIPRVQFRLYEFDGSQQLLEENLRLEFGIARDLSVSFDLPVYQGFFDAPRPSDGAAGLGDADLLAELRILREDLNAVDTVRAALFAGAELPTGTGGFTDPSLDPCVGGVFSAITGRHGIDFAARYTVVTGEGIPDPIFIGDLGEDLVNLDVGYAYRIAPAEYGEERVAAWYLTAELNTQLTTGGHREILLSPGLLIEAPTYAVEIGAGIPIDEDVGRAERLDFSLLVGLRLLF
jgi:hypothetical protein